MKSIHLHKVYAITKVKFQAFFGKNCIIMPLFAIGFTLVFRFLYQYVLGDGKMTDDSDRKGGIERRFLVYFS